MGDDLAALCALERDHNRKAAQHQREAAHLRKRIKKLIKQGRYAARQALRDGEHDETEVRHGR
jgi:hypothetical protein